MTSEEEYEVVKGKYPENTPIVHDVQISVGEFVFTKDEVEQKLNVTILDFTSAVTEEHFKVAIPMGHPLGNLFFTG